MRRIAFLLTALMLATPAMAATAPCPAPQDAADASLAAVGARLDVFLADGRQIYFPTLEPPRPSAAAPNRPQEVVAELTSLLAGKALLVQPLGGPDRWGRIPARLFVEGESESADETLVAAGLAMATAQPGPCADAVRAVEAAARAEKIGLWTDPAFAVLDAGHPQDFSARAGTLALVEGKVRNIGHTVPWLYLNLGDRFGGATLTIARKLQPAFQRAGLSEKSLLERRIRARGIVEIGSGPQIELFHPTQIEFMDEPPAPAPLAAGAGAAN